MSGSFVWPERVLVAIAFEDDPLDLNFGLSSVDKHLIEQARWFASKVGASLSFLTVIEGKDHTVHDSDKTLHQLYRDRAAPILEQVVSETLTQGIEASYRIDEGISWYRIISAVKMEDHDMVMVAPNTAHRDWIERVSHGSTTTRLLRKCPAAVWVVPPGLTVDVGRVLVPIDFSELSHKTVLIAEAFHDLLGAERVALHCPDYPGTIAARRMPDPEEAIAAYRAEVQDDARAQLNEMLGERADDWHILIGELPLNHIINAAIEAEEVDLVIMGSVARTGLKGFLMGNTAEKVLRHLEAPVLVIKPEGWSSPL